MNELARFVSFSFGFTQNYRIVDRAGNPWFVVKDICRILEISYYRQTISRFPAEWKDYIICAVTSSDGTYKNRARKTQKVLIINEASLYRLITRSDKPVARELQDKIFGEILPAYRKHGINWASLPKIWCFRGQMYNYPEWRAKKEEAYSQRFPDASLDDFLRTLPLYSPETPSEDEKAAQIRVIGREGNITFVGRGPV
jgi:prophage antirepressor-like protein